MPGSGRCGPADRPGCHTRLAAYRTTAAVSLSEAGDLLKLTDERGTVAEAGNPRGGAVAKFGPFRHVTGRASGSASRSPAANAAM